MNWYYAAGQEQRGPVATEEFERLVREGVIQAQTLVWREGLPEWKPYGTVATDVGAAIGAPPVVSADGMGASGGVVCAGCRGSFSAQDVIALGGASYCAACKPAAIQRLKEGAAVSTEAEATRRTYLKHEASVKSVGLLYYLGGAAMILFGVLTLLGGGRGRESGDVMLSVLLGLFVLAVGVGQIAVGTGLRRLRRWARVPTGILSGFGLLGFPMGTLINGYILYLVFGEKGKYVFSEEYQAVIEQTPHVKYRTSVVVLVLLGLLGFFVIIGIIGLALGGRY